MQKFEHRLRTTVHTRSVEQIMTRSHAVFPQGREHKPSNPKLDNISTYLRKFEIDRENLNLAKRIMQCESEHSRDKYGKEWKKTKKFIRVRSNFKPQLSAQEPKMYRFQGIPGHGRLLLRLVLVSLTSHMRQLNCDSLYLLKFNLGGTHLIPNKQFLTTSTAEGYACALLVPLFLSAKSITVKMIKVVENSLYDAGKFIVQLQNCSLQESPIISNTGKVIGHACFRLETKISQREEGGGEGREERRGLSRQDEKDKQNQARSQSTTLEHSQLKPE